MIPGETGTGGAILQERAGAGRAKGVAKEGGARHRSGMHRVQRSGLFGVAGLGLVLAVAGVPAGAEAEGAGVAEAKPDLRPRLLITTDIGGDPDDTQSLIRLMVYANHFRIEGLVASAAGTPGELQEAVTRPDLIRQVVEAYGQVLPGLEQHEGGWPSAAELLTVVKSGNPQRGWARVGPGHDTEGSHWIVGRVDAGSAADPLNLSIWGGQTDLAQALWRVQADRGKDGLAAFMAKLRVYEINDQDKIGAQMGAAFPGMFYLRAQAEPPRDKREGMYRGMYLGGDESLTSRDWIEANIRASGPLGALYPVKTWTAPNPHGCLKEGDTPAWFFFLPKGGNDPADPTRPGWGGCFVPGENGLWRDAPGPDEERDSRWHVWRWRPDFQADFARRMSWCRGAGAEN